MNLTARLSASAVSHAPRLFAAAKGKDPFENIEPDFTVFGAKFDAVWKKVAGGAWALALIVSALYLLHGLAGMAQNKVGNPGQLRESKKEATVAGIAFALTAAFGVILETILIIVS